MVNPATRIVMVEPILEEKLHFKVNPFDIGTAVIRTCHEIIVAIYNFTI
jgi:hypothetical protein